MENDSQPTISQSPMTPASIAPAPASSNQIIAKPSNRYELFMAIFGGLSIFSLLINNGFLLKLTASIFLIIAIVSIVKSMSAPKPPAPVVAVNSTNPNFAAIKQPRSPLKTLGMIIVVIALLPIIAYGLMIAFFILILMFGGGRMGT